MKVIVAQRWCERCDRYTDHWCEVLRERQPMMVGDIEAQVRVLSAPRCGELDCGEVRV